ncbi:MAG: YbaK/EbsC family protein [Desulfosarcinaceae bacterium]
MSTRALAFLKQKRIAHETVKYEHEEKGAEFAARAVGFPLDRTIKTLVVALDNIAYVLGLMPGDRQLSLKKIAAACGAKKAAMADRTTAERLTGYLLGGISPFGIRQQLPAVMDSGLQAHDSVMINGGRRGLMVKMAPGDIVDVLNARIAAIAQD